MKKNHKNLVAAVLDEFFKKKRSEETNQKFYNWLLKDKHQDLKKEALMERFESYNLEPDESVERSLAEMHKRLGFNEPEKKKVPIRRNWLRVAAVLLPLAIVTGGYFFLTRITEHAQATELVEVSVPHGDKKHIVLPDGSEVWVNAGSTLRYPSAFDTDKRQVELTGEAYFSVSSDAAKPFFVKTADLTVKVLGTEFNVEAYPDMCCTEVLLSEGKVETTTRQGNVSTLVPGQCLVYDRSSSEFSIKELPAEEQSDWKSGVEFFNYTTLNDILHTLERRYNITINADKSLLTDETYSFRLEGSDNMESAMEILKNMIEGLDYSINGTNVTIYKH